MIYFKIAVFILPLEFFTERRVTANLSYGVLFLRCEKGVKYVILTFFTGIRPLLL
jgi:hypothetical protein